MSVVGGVARDECGGGGGAGVGGGREEGRSKGGAWPRLQVGVEGPELGVLVQATLHGAGLLDVRGAVGGGRDLGGLLEHLEGLVVLLMAQLHLRPAHPHRGQVVDDLVRHEGGLAQDDACVLHVAVRLVEEREGEPQVLRLAQRLLRVDRLDRGGEGVDDLGGVRLEEMGALEPLVHVVRVLPQEHRGEQLAAACHEALEAGEAHVEVELLGALEVGLALRLDLGRDHALLELRVRVEEHAEVAHLNRGRG